jgi:hypothetical protein
MYYFDGGNIAFISSGYFFSSFSSDNEYLVSNCGILPAFFGDFRSGMAKRI